MPYGIHNNIMLRFVECFQHKSNRHQICWLVQKVRVSESAAKQGCNSFQEVLDTRLYSKQFIRCYELVYGKNFCCAGGMPHTEVTVILQLMRYVSQSLRSG